MLQVVKAQDHDMTSLEVRMASQVNGITQNLEYLSKDAQAVKKDVGVFSAIKHLVTDVELEARAASTHADLKVLTAQTKGFAEHLDGYL